MSMMWVGIGSAVLAAGSSIYGSNQAADASKSGNKKAINAQLSMYNQGRADLAPYRAAGYGALDQIMALYGIPGAGYSGQSVQYGQPITVKGNAGGGGGGGNGLAGALIGAGAAGLGGLAAGPVGLVAGGVLGSALGGGGEKRVVGGVIDPRTGTVDAQGGTAGRDAAFTEYLRTGTPMNLSGREQRKYADLLSAIDRLRASGWSYEDAKAMAAGEAGLTRDDVMANFYTSPQYEFNRSEALRGLEQSAAARGGAFSGTAIRGSQNLASNLASGEFNSYVDRLFNIAGLGNSSSTNSAQMAQNTGSNVAQLYQNQGNARASSYLTGAAGVNNALQGGLQNYAFMNYLNNQPSGAAGGSPYGVRYPFDATPPNYSLVPGGRP